MIGQEGYMTVAVRILNNKHNFRGSLRSKRVGMVRVSSESELHDLEQILRANFCTFSSA